MNTKKLTVGLIKKMIKDLPDDAIVELSSDTGLDQSYEGEVTLTDVWVDKINNKLQIYGNIISIDDFIMNDLREASRDLADFAPDLIEVSPEFYEQLEVNSSILKLVDKKDKMIPDFYGVKVVINENLKKPYRFIRGGEEVE